MGELYDTYSTIMNGPQLSHQQDIERTSRQFKQVLLPIFQAEGIRIAEASIFEFGAGWGKNLLALKALGARNLQGADISQEQIELGRQLGLDSLRLITPEDDLGQLMAGARFDIILAYDILEHLTIKQIEQFAAAVRGLLRPGGLLVVEVPNDLAPLNPIRSGDLTHLRAFTGASITQFFRLCHLEPMVIRGVGFPGEGGVHRLRTWLSDWILGPSLVLLMRILYGRADPHGIYQPNILGIGKLPGVE
ncbi:MAG: class I SAM-dependent methyltransferase [Holophagaceae bacterium]|uniref:Class I SAM-dependent methyltransferase n=1 Tax=Candidatus Geothrix skivensis TaxID=2954439 RepID=A0A9D7SLC2_9BACT|nr:class I SAM-dependent methyltransferase [Candidatus Geothrix skivensis]